MPGPKKQHYLPRFYLAGFGRDGKVWVHHAERGVYEWRNPKSLATRKHYYSVETDTSEMDLTVENVLGMVENTAAQIIRKLDAGEPIDYWDKIHLAQFVALMKFRVPFFERYFADVSDASVKQIMKSRFPNVESVQEELEASGRSDPDNPRQAEDILRGLQNPGYRVESNAATRIAAMLILTLQISRVLTLLEWTFVVAPEETSFVTSDDPVVVLGSGPPPQLPDDWPGEMNPFSLAGDGFASPEAQTIVPLSQRVLLAAEGEGTKMEIAQVDRESVREANLTVAARRDNLLVARDEALLRRLVGG